MFNLIGKKMLVACLWSAMSLNCFADGCQLHLDEEEQLLRRGELELYLGCKKICDERLEMCWKKCGSVEPRKVRGCLGFCKSTGNDALLNCVGQGQEPTMLYRDTFWQ